MMGTETNDPATQLIGQMFTAAEPYLVTAQMIVDFCAAIGETNPLYTDPEAAARGPYGGLTAPPAFAAAIRDENHTFRHLPEYGTRRLAAGMDVEFIRPIRAGDWLSLTTQIHEVYEKTGRSGPMTFVVLRSTLSNQDGAVVAHIDHRFVHRP